MSKRLTQTRLAAAGIRAHKREYLSLLIGVALAIFFVSSLVLCCFGMYEAERADFHAALGKQDAALLDAGGIDDRALTDSGMVREIGTVTLLGKAADTDIYLGYYDAAADAMLSRTCIDGRMPQASGEIAVEYTKLLRMRIDAKVGDAITLPMLGLGAEEAVDATYTLVGVLKEQRTAMGGEFGWGFSGAVAMQWSSVEISEFPAMVVASGTPVFPGAHAAFHKLVTFTPGTSAKAFEEYASEHWDRGGVLNFSFNYLKTFASSTLPVFVGFLGAALLICACVGIVGALTSQLSRRREEIGLLRAVGATKRQIRRIFGREALMIACLSAPASIAASCGLIYVLSSLLPGELRFAVSPPYLLAALAFSLMLVTLAAYLPLRKASRQAPMGVLRDTGALRRIRRVKTQAAFSVPGLLARRYIRLYPFRQAGAAFLCALLVLVISLGAMGFNAMGLTRTQDNEAFVVYAGGGFWSSTSFAQIISTTTGVLTAQDVAQIAALPTVSRVETQAQAFVGLALPSATEYLKPSPNVRHSTMNAHLLSDEEYAALYEALWDQKYTYRGDFNGDYKRLKQALNLTGDLAMMHMQIQPIDAGALSRYVADGSIDLAALNAGRQVLVVAPDIYSYQDKNFGVRSYPAPLEGETPLSVKRNDQFRAGDTLDILQMLMTEEELPNADEDMMPTERYEARTTVGAVLAFDQTYQSAEPYLLTTPEGYAALGLKTLSPTAVSIWLSAAPEPDMEAYLEQEITRIAMRAENADVRNRIAEAKTAQRETLNALIMLGSIALLFLTVAIAMISGDAARRIRSEVKTLGMLRAVGADGRMLAGAYTRQIAYVLLQGFLLGEVFCALLYGLSTGFDGALVKTAAHVGFLLVAFLCCWLSVRARIRATLRQSVVENIREL